MSCTEEQLHQYLKHINYPKEKHASEPLRLLEELQARQLSTVPFESTALHYSKHRLLSLDLDDLFQKIVIDGKGGYCMELNTFFGAVLRGLGFTLINIGARVKNGDRYGSWGHMANLVTIDDKRYLVDVGFGADGPMRPVPLQNGYEYLVLPRQLGKLEYRSLAQHTDPNQRIWVYSIQDLAIAEWRECYCFTDLEYFPEDFVAMNLSPMTRPTSFFVKTVLAMRAIIDERTNVATGVITLYKDTIKRKYMGEIEVLETLQNETQRIKALERYFGIVLKPSEQKAIRGLATELIGQ